MSIIRKDPRWYIDPFKDFARLEDEMHHLFNSTFGERGLSLNDRVHIPLIDIRETDTNFIIDADIPGFKKEEISIDVTSDAIEISAEHKEEKIEKKKGKIIRQERCSSKFYRSLSFPSPIDTEKINPSFNNGTLKLELTKLPETEKKRITL